jgi:hypothetical protein
MGIPMRDEEMGAIHVESNSRVVIGLFLRGELATSRWRDKLSRIQKFNLSSGTERLPSRCHTNLKEHWKHRHCDKWGEFLHQDQRHVRDSREKGEQT